MKIPSVFADNTTMLKNHTIKTHMFCLLLRTALGILIITGKMPINVIYILCVSVIIMFGNKYFKLPNVWKVYLRTIFVYAVVLFLTYVYGDKYRHISGTLLIVDVLLSIQSRHIFERLSLL
jgi:hypothetical protein